MKIKYGVPLVIFVSIFLSLMLFIVQLVQSNSFDNYKKGEVITATPNIYNIIEKRDLLGNKIYYFTVEEGNLSNLIIESLDFPQANEQNFKVEKVTPASSKIIQKFDQKSFDNQNQVKEDLGENYNEIIDQALNSNLDSKTLILTDSSLNQNILYNPYFQTFVNFILIFLLLLSLFFIFKVSKRSLKFVLFILSVISFFILIFFNLIFSNLLFSVRDSLNINNYSKNLYYSKINEDLTLEWGVPGIKIDLDENDFVKVLSNQSENINETEEGIVINRKHFLDNKSIKFFIKKDNLKLVHFNVEIAKPLINLEEVKSEIIKVLGSNSQNYGVYAYDLINEIEIAVNENTWLAPASISKVPPAILVLRDIEAGKYTLETEFALKDSHRAYTFDKFYNYQTGTRIKIIDILTDSIILSDNTANAMLEDLAGGAPQVNKRTKDELGAEVFWRFPHESTAKDIGTVFKGIYYQKYLSKENNDLLIQLLIDTAAWLQDGIPELLPEGTVVAHKTGQLPGYSWEDAGIVYGTQTDFVMVVINQAITYDDARPKVQKVSKIVYDVLNPSQLEYLEVKL